MESDALPTDATTLIYLAKADALLDAWECLERVAVPPAVWREAVEAGRDRHPVQVQRIEQAASWGFIERVPMTEALASRAATFASRERLGQGESEALALGLDRGIVMVDEGRATRVAIASGVTPISTMLIPVVGFERGALAPWQARQLIARLAPVTGVRADVVSRLDEYLKEWE